MVFRNAHGARKAYVHADLSGPILRPHDLKSPFMFTAFGAAVKRKIAIFSGNLDILTKNTRFSR